MPYPNPSLAHILVLFQGSVNDLGNVDQNVAKSIISTLNHKVISVTIILKVLFKSNSTSLIFNKQVLCHISVQQDTFISSYHQTHGVCVNSLAFHTPLF